jgi:hypothetical protein
MKRRSQIMSASMKRIENNKKTKRKKRMYALSLEKRENITIRMEKKQSNNTQTKHNDKIYSQKEIFKYMEKPSEGAAVYNVTL